MHVRLAAAWDPAISELLAAGALPVPWSEDVSLALVGEREGRAEAALGLQRKDGRWLLRHAMARPRRGARALWSVLAPLLVNLDALLAGGLAPEIVIPLDPALPSWRILRRIAARWGAEPYSLEGGIEWWVRRAATEAAHG